MVNKAENEKKSFDTYLKNFIKYQEQLYKETETLLKAKERADKLKELKTSLRNKMYQMISKGVKKVLNKKTIERFKSLKIECLHYPNKKLSSIYVTVETYAFSHRKDVINTESLDLYLTQGLTADDVIQGHFTFQRENKIVKLLPLTAGEKVLLDL